MIKYSLKAKQALAHFFSPFNDIDIFVEDTSCRNFYEIIINRILDNKAKVSRIIQLGGRDNVLEICRNDQDIKSRNRLYIIDGDFDLILGINAPKLKHLYRLNVYSCENLVLCSEATNQISYEWINNKTITFIKKKINYNGFIQSIESELLDLFILYAMSYTYDSSIETVGFHVFRLCDSNSGPPRLNKKKINERINQIKKNLQDNFTKKQIENKISEITDNIKRKGYQATQVVSGKTYFLPLLWSHLKRKTGYRGNVRTLLVQLARYSRLDVDPKFVEAVKKASKNLK